MERDDPVAARAVRTAQAHAATIEIAFGQHLRGGLSPVAALAATCNQLGIDLGNPVVHVDAAGGPEDGHLWEVTWRCRGSYAVTGEPGHREADWWSEPLTARVRAWDLAAAWGQVAAVPPHRWFAHLDDEPRPDTPEAP